LICCAGCRNAPVGSVLAVEAELVAKELIETLRSQRGLARRVLDVAMPEVGPDRTLVAAAQ
jgi:hypothetical protein